MDKTILDGLINSKTGYELKFINGQLVISLKYDGAGADVLVSCAISPEYFLDKLAEAIPGKLDDAVFEYLKNQFLKSNE